MTSSEYLPQRPTKQSLFHRTPSHPLPDNITSSVSIRCPAHTEAFKASGCVHRHCSGFKPPARLTHPGFSCFLLCDSTQVSSRAAPASQHKPKVECDCLGSADASSHRPRPGRCNQAKQTLRHRTGCSVSSHRSRPGRQTYETLGGRPHARCFKPPTPAWPTQRSASLNLLTAIVQFQATDPDLADATPSNMYGC